MEPALIALIVIALLVIVVIAKSVTIVPQAQAKVVERLGRYSRTLSPGPHRSDLPPSIGGAPRQLQSPAPSPTRPAGPDGWTAHRQLHLPVL